MKRLLIVAVTAALALIAANSAAQAASSGLEFPSDAEFNLVDTAFSHCADQYCEAAADCVRAVVTAHSGPDQWADLKSIVGGVKPCVAARSLPSRSGAIVPRLPVPNVGVGQATLWVSMTLAAQQHGVQRQAALLKAFNASRAETPVLQPGPGLGAPGLLFPQGVEERAGGIMALGPPALKECLLNAGRSRMGPKFFDADTGTLAFRDCPAYPRIGPASRLLVVMVIGAKGSDEALRQRVLAESGQAK